MTPIFTVDGVSYQVTVPEGGLKRAGKVLDGENAHRAKSGKMIRDVIGTFYNYALTLETKDLNVSQYDALYQVLSAPVDYHTVVMPYGQNTITFKAYVSNVDDELKMIRGNRKIWGGLTFNFIAMEPQRAG